MDLTDTTATASKRSTDDTNIHYSSNNNNTSCHPTANTHITSPNNDNNIVINNNQDNLESSTCTSSRTPNVDILYHQEVTHPQDVDFIISSEPADSNVTATAVLVLTGAANTNTTFLGNVDNNSTAPANYPPGTGIHSHEDDDDALLLSTEITRNDNGAVTEILNPHAIAATGFTTQGDHTTRSISSNNDNNNNHNNYNNMDPPNHSKIHVPSSGRHDNHGELLQQQQDETLLTMMLPMQPAGENPKHQVDDPQQQQQQQQQQHHQHQLQIIMQQQFQLQPQTSTTNTTLDPTSILSSNISADVVSTAAAAAAAYGSLLPNDAEDMVQTQQIAQMNMIQGQHRGSGDSMTSGGGSSSNLVCDQGNSISGSDGDGGEDSREQHLASRRLKDRERYASMSEEQREEYNHKRREQYHRQSEESRKRRRERERERYHSLPPEQAKERNVRRATLERERYKRLSADELAARNAKRRARAAAMRAQKRTAQQGGGGGGGGSGGLSSAGPVVQQVAQSSSSSLSEGATVVVAASVASVAASSHPPTIPLSVVKQDETEDVGQLHPSMMGMILPLVGMDGTTDDMACTTAVNLPNAARFQQHAEENIGPLEHQSNDDQDHHH